MIWHISTYLTTPERTCRNHTILPENWVELARRNNPLSATFPEGSRSEAMMLTRYLGNNNKKQKTLRNGCVYRSSIVIELTALGSIFPKKCLKIITWVDQSCQIKKCAHDIKNQELISNVPSMLARKFKMKDIKY